MWHFAKSDAVYFAISIDFLRNICYHIIMNDKLRRIIAIIALVFLSLFTILLIIYLCDTKKTLLNGSVGDLVIWTGAIGLALCLVLWLAHAFPAQQVKDEQRERLRREEQGLDAEDKTDEDKTNEEQKEQEQNDYSNKNSNNP